MRWLLPFLALAACEPRRDHGAIDREAASALFDELVIETPPGISDITVDDRGVLWAVAERDRAVIELELGKSPIVHELEGLTRDLDTEAIVWLGNGKFAFGIEGTISPVAAVMLGELRGNDIVITSTRSLLRDELDLAISINHGIEALCGREGELLAGIESVGRLDDGTRWAPLVRLRGDASELVRLRLTTKKGKLSALTCTIDDDGVAQVVAIERHFGVVRLLRFTVGREDKDVTPAIELDLFPILRDHFNLEGITRLPDGRLVLVNDNQNKTVDGPTQLFVFKAR